MEAYGNSDKLSKKDGVIALKNKLRTFIAEKY